MTERSIFLEALDKEDPTERSAYLDAACADDAALRERVELLLRSHDQAGSFLGKLGPERLAEEFAVQESADATQDKPLPDRESDDLDFLEASEQPGSLGRLGHYEVLELIGRGGMGIVLKAFDERLRRVVAIKVLAPELASGGTARRRFAREAQAAAAVRNEHVIAIHAVEETAPVPYLVMEYIDGVSLQERLDQSGPLEIREILRIGLQTAAGLAAAHAQGLVHRDVKPANILLENGVQRVKIGDFGLARAADDASLTQEGVVAGTPQYMSPEQAEGHLVDHRSDLFSLGSVLYAMCTGRPPFRAHGTMAVLKRVCEDTPPPIREINPDVPPWLVEVIDRLHAKDPARRFQSAEEVGELLGRELARLQLPTSDRPETAPPAPARTSYRRSVTAAIMLVLVAGVVLTESLGITRLAATVRGRSIPDELPAAKVDEGNYPAIPADSSTSQADGKDGIPVKPSASVPSDPIKPFVVLATAGRDELSSATLAEAVTAAQEGDTIEIRGNGPFATPCIVIKGKPLVIRAAPGFQPVITLDPTAAKADARQVSLLITSSPLILEGIEFRMDGQKVSYIVRVISAPLHVSNCIFTGSLCGLRLQLCPEVRVQNCQICCRFPIGVEAASFSRAVLENNLLVAGDRCLSLPWSGRSPLMDVSIRMVSNTCVGLHVLMVQLGEDASAHPVRIESETNLFVVAREGSFLTTDALEPEWVEWRERGNCYDIRHAAFLIGSVSTPLEGKPPVRNLEDWNRFWNLKDTRSIQGPIGFRQGDPDGLLMRSLTERLTPDSFRLAPGSAGKSAGKDGRDLGADVDLVGTGPAYERWKQTPAYQEWLKDTGQRK